MRFKWPDLDKECWLLLVLGKLYALAGTLSSSFVNVYLWKVKHNLSLIGWFHLVHFVVATLTFVFAGWLCKKYDRVISMRLGLVSLCIFYFVVLFLGENSANYTFLLGALIGLGAGFFWLAFHVLYFEITERDNRDLFNAISGLMNSFMGIIGPILSGYIISLFIGTQGYRIIFTVSLCLYILAVAISFIFRPRPASGSYNLGRILRDSWRRGSNWFWINLAVIAQGIREGIFYFVVGLLVYMTTDNELIMGSFLTTVSIFTMISYAVEGRIITYERRYKSIFFATMAMGLSVLPFVYYVNEWSVIFLGLVAALAYPFYMSPFTATVFDQIGVSQRSVAHRVEYVVVREISLNLGRAAGLLGFIWWMRDTSSLEHLRWFLLLVAFPQVLVWVFMRRVKTPTPLARR